MQGLPSTHEGKPWRSHPVLRTLYCGVLLAFHASCAHFTWYYTQELAALTSIATMNPKWIFGQIVSVTIWFGPIFEYIYLEIRGMQCGYRYRLHERYLVMDRNDIAVAPREGTGRSRMSAFFLRPV